VQQLPLVWRDAYGWQSRVGALLQGRFQNGIGGYQHLRNIRINGGPLFLTHAEFLPIIFIVKKYGHAAGFPAYR
jgi:hypothetical protein